MNERKRTENTAGTDKTDESNEMHATAMNDTRFEI